MAPKKPGGKPGKAQKKTQSFENAYREHLRKVKQYWVELDVEAIDLTTGPDPEDPDGAFLCHCVPWWAFKKPKKSKG